MAEHEPVLRLKTDVAAIRAATEALSTHIDALDRLLESHAADALALQLHVLSTACAADMAPAVHKECCRTLLRMAPVIDALHVLAKYGDAAVSARP